jgi:poly(3-hydroxybutyrate) depolymerase
MFDNSHHNGNMYTALEMQRFAVLPVNLAAEAGKQFFSHVMNPIAYTKIGRQMAAGCELLERMTRRFTKPEFGITVSKMNGYHKPVRIYEKTVMHKPFGDLIHFRKSNRNKERLPKQPRLLIVAPLSGHFATLCRGTVEDLLPFYDIYITDWTNASDVPLSKGNFDLDDYINYVIEFIERINHGELHLLGVCQPTVPVLAAVSLMATAKNPKVPNSMTLIGGPIDARQNPTEVNKPYSWFEQQVIMRVPANYLGYMRKVYPGFLQLTGFMTMNLDKHIKAHQDLFDHLVEGDGDGAEAHRKFYNEYLSVMDIPAEFYLQTIKSVFQNYDLPNGTMISRGRPVRPQDVTQTACFTLEGERDDITGKEQTKAALKLLQKLPESKKKHMLVADVGHYGLFNGRRFREQIVPEIRAFTEKNTKKS